LAVRVQEEEVMVSPQGRIPRGHGGAFAAALAALALAAPGLAETPDLSGKWILNVGRSDDVTTKIEAAAGPDDVKGSGEGGGRERWIPHGEGGEVDRVHLRELMLSVAQHLDEMDITQDAKQIKINHDDLLRIYYFGREHVRQSATGEKLKTRSSWKGQQLVIDQEGGKGLRIVETYTLLPGGDHIVETLRYENSLLQQPLEIKLIYDRAEGSGEN
jgi:hypothetical protein